MSHWMAGDYYVHSYSTFRVLQIAGQKEIDIDSLGREKKTFKEQLATFPSAQPTSQIISSTNLHKPF